MKYFYHHSMGDGDNDYREDRRFILEELKRLDRKQEHMGSEIADMRNRMISNSRFDGLEVRTRACEAALVGLTVRASVWGGLAGLIPVVLWLAFRAISGK